MNFLAEKDTKVNAEGRRQLELSIAFQSRDKVKNRLSNNLNLVGLPHPSDDDFTGEHAP